MRVGQSEPPRSIWPKQKLLGVSEPKWNPKDDAAVRGADTFDRSMPNPERIVVEDGCCPQHSIGSKRDGLKLVLRPNVALAQCAGIVHESSHYACELIVGRVSMLVVKHAVFERDHSLRNHTEFRAIYCQRSDTGRPRHISRWKG